MEEPEESQEPQELGAEERQNIEADLDDLSGRKGVFGGQGVRGVVIACPDCGSNHFYEWDLLRENLEHMLRTGEPRMHEPAFEPREDEYIQWDYGKGYIDALTDTGLQPDKRIVITPCPRGETIFEPHFQFCPKCGRSPGAVRVYRELIGRGMDERDVPHPLLRARHEPLSTAP